MSQSPIAITYSLEELLKQINDKLDNVQKDLNEIKNKDLVELKVGQARVEERLTSIETRLDKLETTQKH